MNAQLPAPLEQAGDYSSGGSHPYYQAVYRAAAPFNALYAYGEARGFGFSPFAVDSLPAADNALLSAPELADEYTTLGQLSDIVLESQQAGKTRALVLHEHSPRSSQTVALGGYLFRASLLRSWPAKNLLESDGALMAIETAPNEFLVLGSGLSVTFQRDPDTDNRIAGIAAIDQLSDVDGDWTTARRFNGDQSNQGRELMMDAHAFHVYRVKL